MILAVVFVRHGDTCRRRSTRAAEREVFVSQLLLSWVMEEVQMAAVVGGGRLS